MHANGLAYHQFPPRQWREMRGREPGIREPADGSSLSPEKQHCLPTIASHAQLTIDGQERAGGWQQKEHSANAYVIATERSVTMNNPKTELTDNTQKDPDEWVSGDDPMTGAQASYLKTLCEQAGTPEMYDDNLTKAQASKLIDEMREKANV
jgi:hypothetical protein